MVKRKKRVLPSKKRKAEEKDEKGEKGENEEAAPSAKKVAASSTSFTEGDNSQISSINSIGTSEGTLGFSSHFWCNYCEFSADTKQELVTHMRQHMIKCSFCPFSSLSRAEVLRHVKGEHDDEMEVDSSSSSVDHDMDKDPCCACIFCDFMTYSTEYLENHTTNKHRGMLPKSVAKMISKAVSAKIRKADALFYSTLSGDMSKFEKSPPERDPEFGKFEQPSSSNTIVIEEEGNDKSPRDVKPVVKDFPIVASTPVESKPTSAISSCGQLDHAVEEQVERIVSGITQTLSQFKEAESEWKVKVETIYCLCCPYSSVAVDKLKCHTFSQHPKEAAVAKNTSTVSAHELPDMTFFCVQESCNHSTNTCIVYEEHMMSCCPVNENMPDDIIERLKSTLKFLSEFHNKHSSKAAPGFLDYVSSVNKLLASRMAALKSSVGNSAEGRLDGHLRTASQNILPQTVPIHNSSLSNVSPNVRGQYHPEIMSTVQSSSIFPPKSINSVANHSNALYPAMPVDRDLNIGQSSVTIPQNNTTLSRSDLSHSHFSTPNVDIYPNTANHVSSGSIPQLPNQPLVHPVDNNNANQRNVAPPSSEYPAPSFSTAQTQINQSNPLLDSHSFNQGPMPSTVQGQQRSLFDQQGRGLAATNMHRNSHNGTLTMNSTPFNNSSQATISAFNNSSQATISASTMKPMSSNESILSIDPSVGGQLNVPFNSAPNLPTQQFQQSVVPGRSGHLGNNAPMTSSSSNPPKMMDLLSNSYSILLDDDLDMTTPLVDQVPGFAPHHQSTVSQQQLPLSHPQGALSNVQGNTSNPQGFVSDSQSLAPQQPAIINTDANNFGAVGAGTQLPSNPPQASMQQPATPFPQGSVPQQSAMPSYPNMAQSQQAAGQSSFSNLPNDVQDIIPLQTNGSNINTPIATVSDQFNSSFGQSIVPEAQNFMSSQAPVTNDSGTQHYNNNVLQVSDTNSQPLSMITNQFSAAPPAQFQAQSVLSAPTDTSSSAQGTDAMSAFPLPEHQGPLASFQEGQSSTPSSILPAPNSVPSNLQDPGQNMTIIGGSSQPATVSFLESSSGSSGVDNSPQQVKNWQGSQPSNLPNFLDQSSQAKDNSVEVLEVFQPDTNPPTTPNAQSVDAGQAQQSSTASHVTPVKNQPPVNMARANIAAGNSPLSPSIYLNGQAPRHHRSNWTSSDIMPRGVGLPPIRQRGPGPGLMNFPNPGNIRQNLFPPRARGRGRPRGPRMYNRLPNPSTRPQDDDVIVTAVVRGPPPQQSPGQPLNRRGMARGQRRPMSRGPGVPRGPGRGMMRHPGPPGMSRKPFDVSKHFVDLACVVNTGNEDELNNEDDIQIMGVTPGGSGGAGGGNTTGKAQAKVVDAKKFSFCCVHCGKDQGSKQVMKKHMKTNHNDSLLGAFRNVETGQFLFFCPQLRCEFMTYSEGRLTEHLYSCYNLDKAKQLPFDLPSALKNLRSLKIRKVNTNVVSGSSLNNPIDLDGQGLRDTFNNNLTDAFDDMVENTIGRGMPRPNTNNQPPSTPPMNQPPTRAPLRQPRGRPIGGNNRMSRPPYYQPRQPHMMQRPPGLPGDPKMRDYPPYFRATGRRNFRQGLPVQPMRGNPNSRMMMRPGFRGRPPNPQMLPTLQNLGNEQTPILIDVDSESPETISQTQDIPMTSNNPPATSQSGPFPESSSMSTEITGTTPVTISDLSNPPIDSAQSSSSTQNITTEAQSEIGAETTSLQPPTVFNENNQIPNFDTRADTVQPPFVTATDTVQPPLVTATDTVQPPLVTATDAVQPPLVTATDTVQPPLVTATDTVLPPLVTATDTVQPQTDNWSSTSMQPNQPGESDVPSGHLQPSTGSGVVGADVPEPVCIEDDHSVAEDNEEQVNAILLEKVFAKVPHMPKKLSQRLVLRFKEFAAKRGVVITPNSKVIDEFVERISYKGSNPMSKQYPQQQQQQQQQLEQHQSSVHSMQNPTTASHSSTPPLSAMAPSIPAIPANRNSTIAESQYQHQTNTSPHQQEHAILPPQSDNRSLPQYHDQPSKLSQDQAESSECQNQSNISYSQNRPSNVQDQTQIHVSSIQNRRDSNSGASFDGNDTQSQSLPQQDPNATIENLGNERDEGDIIETKIILAERELKFSGAFANIAKSVIDQGKRTVKSEHGWSASTSPNSSSSSHISAPVGHTNVGGAMQNVISSAQSSRHPGGRGLSTSLTSSVSDGHSSLSFREQLSVNEKLLKKEPIPMAFPSTAEGEAIMVQSSVDHLVSGNDGLEVDIAGKPLYSNSVLSEDAPAEENSKTPEKKWVAEDSMKKEMPPACKVQESIIDKASGRIILRVKKGDIPRKVNDASIGVVATRDKPRKVSDAQLIGSEPNSDDSNEKTMTAENVEAETPFVRRSERKRKVRECVKDEDAMNEFDAWLSDDDEEYQVESDDDSYDESKEYKKGHSSKKKSKAPVDPDAFDIRQKGSFLCWLCFKKFVSCLSVKKHILKKHPDSMALCAISQEEAEGTNSQQQLQLLLLCHRHCKYATIKQEAYSHHITACHKTEFVMEGQDLMEIQSNFLESHYLELQEGITSGALLDAINQSSTRVAKRKRQTSGNSSSADSQKEMMMDQGCSMNTPLLATTTTTTPPPSNPQFCETSDAAFYPSVL